MTKKDRRSGDNRLFGMAVELGKIQDRRVKVSKKGTMPAKTWTKAQEASLIEALVAAQGKDLDWAAFIDTCSSLLSGRGKKTEAQVKSKCSSIRTRAKRNGVDIKIPRKPAHLAKNIDDALFFTMISKK